MKTMTKITHLALALIVCVLTASVQAVSPPPDGGYPGGNTAEGQNALLSLAGGSYNTAVGFLSLLSNTTTSFNTALGAGALLSNTADENTGVGAGALLSNTTGANNTAVGAFALSNNSNGDYITALGTGTGTDPGIVRNNIYIGDPGFGGDENVISIGGIAASGTPYELTFIGGIYGSEVNTGTALPVYVDTDGHLGTSLVNASGQKLRIRGPQGAQHQGSLNEFQKQQKRIAELEANIAQQQKQIEALAAGLQKVSAQLGATKPTLQTVSR